MKRLHIHVNTSQGTFQKSIEFYSTLFGTLPTLEREAYAKWMLEDPKVNFVLEVLEISGDSPGVHHLGIQVDKNAELDQIRDSLKTANAPLLEVGKTSCCYSESEKNWTRDPSGIRWETFHSTATLIDYGAKTPEEFALYNSNSNDSVVDQTEEPVLKS